MYFVTGALLSSSTVVLKEGVVDEDAEWDTTLIPNPVESVVSFVGLLRYCTIDTPTVEEDDDEEEAELDKSRMAEEVLTPSKFSLAVRGGVRYNELIDESLVDFTNELMRTVAVLMVEDCSPTLRADCMPSIRDCTASWTLLNNVGSRLAPFPKTASNALRTVFAIDASAPASLGLDTTVLTRAIVHLVNALVDTCVR